MAMTPEQIGPWIVAIVASAAAGWERHRAAKKTNKLEEDQAVVSEAKAWKNRSEVMEKMASDYELLFKKERETHQETREYHHKANQKFQADLFACNERCNDLQKLTNLAPLIEVIKQQGETLAVISHGIQSLLEKQEHSHL